MKTKTVILNYIETTEETVSTLKTEMCDEKKIKISFDGAIRTFVIGLS